MGACAGRVGQNHIYTVYMRYLWLGKAKYTEYINVYVQFWPTLCAGDEESVAADCDMCVL